MCGGRAFLIHLGGWVGRCCAGARPDVPVAGATHGNGVRAELLRPTPAAWATHGSTARPASHGSQNDSQGQTQGWTLASGAWSASGSPRPGRSAESAYNFSASDGDGTLTSGFQRASGIGHAHASRHAPAAAARPLTPEPTATPPLTPVGRPRSRAPTAGPSPTGRPRTT